jgi:hypothetical protein
MPHHTKKSPQYFHLADKWTVQHREIQKNLWGQHGDVLKKFIDRTKHVAVGAVGSLIMLATPITTILPAVSPPTHVEAEQPNVSDNAFLVSDLYPYIPKEVRALTPQEEKVIGHLLTKHFGFPIVAELEGKRLNRSYGYIGKEQHLARYPGDSMNTHFATPDEAKLYGREGMAPGLGAWRYFASSKEDMTQKEVDMEKYYIAVQTFLAPDYHTRTAEYRDFFKFRKMLVVNPHTGRAMVVVIGDAGPAQWTGKSLGGSPEVMHYLERVDGRAKGPVLYYFIDDPDDKIPLGPVMIKK